MDGGTGKKLGLKERYTVMTRGLGWDTTYQPMDKVFPYDKFEGIKIHDWDKWEDPFRMTMDAYWKYQAEKERKLYAIIDAFAQNNGHLGVTDARYINTLKLFLTGVSPLEYMAHRGFAHVGRQMRGVGPRVACLMQSLDEIRHVQTQIHSMSNYNKHYNGFHDFLHMIERVWYLSVPRSFFDDAYTSGPFEYMIAIGFSFEYVLTNLLFVPFISGAAYNGDMGAMTFGFSAQSDEARHMTLGLECIKFMLEQDPANLPIVQRWIDKWTWRGTRVLTLVGMMMDYMLPKRVMSWKEAWEIYFEQNGGALFNDLARYGVKPPACIAQATIDKEHISHQAWATFYQYGAAADFHTWSPTKDELDWLSAKYPNTFDKYYRPRFEYWADQHKQGKRFYNTTLPQLCQICQIPMLFTEPTDPTKICYRESDFQNSKYHFCSDHCKAIFDHEPEKYVQSWLPVHQIYQGNCFPEGTDPTKPGFEPLPAVLQYYHLNNGRDNLDFEGSEDQKNFATWRDLATKNTRPIQERQGATAMSVVALRKYSIPPADSLDKFHGAQLLYIGWEDHLMFCAPFAFPLPPDMPFGAILSNVLPGCFGAHPDFARIDWAKAQWFKSGKPFSPDPAKSLKDNGLKHKDVIRFRTPGLTGIKGSCA